MGIICDWCDRRTISIKLIVSLFLNVKTFDDYSDYGDVVFYGNRFPINLNFQESVAGKETVS